MAEAAARGDLQAVKGVHESGVPIEALSHANLEAIIDGDHAVVLRHVHETGRSLDQAELQVLLVRAAASDARACFTYLVALSAVPEADDARAIRAAMTANASNVLAWLRSSRQSAILRDLTREGARAPGNAAREVTVFVHLSKTAGTSLNEHFVSIFAESEIFDGNGVNRLTTAIGTTRLDFVKAGLARLSTAERSALRFLGGHVSPGCADGFGKPLRLVTLLRDPIERAISGFEYVRKLGIVADVPADLTLENYVARGQYHCWFSNAQLRVLSGDDALDPPDLPFMTKVDGLRALDTGDVDRVATMLSGFALVGVVERIDLFMRDLSVLLGSERHALPNRNATEGRTPVAALSKATLEAITEANLFDLDLYRRIAARID